MKTAICSLLPPLPPSPNQEGHLPSSSWEIGQVARGEHFINERRLSGGLDSTQEFLLPKCVLTPMEPAPIFIQRSG